VHHGENLAALSDKAEPLGPCDESGRRGVHQSVTLSLGLALAVELPALADVLPLALGLADDKGASGSAVAVLTVFVAGWMRGGLTPVTAGLDVGLAMAGAAIAGFSGTV
jgi:hypothetical protein